MAFGRPTSAFACKERRARCLAPTRALRRGRGQSSRSTARRTSSDVAASSATHACAHAARDAPADADLVELCVELLVRALKRQEKADGRVWADLWVAPTLTRKRDFAGFFLMARPGLEPGTPRFSGSGRRTIRLTECLQISGFKIAVSRRSTAGCGRFPRFWDSTDDLKSQTPAGDLLGAI
jgi:hypothetical protein